jgi:hypothetical protein
MEAALTRILPFRVGAPSVLALELETASNRAVTVSSDL